MITFKQFINEEAQTIDALYHPYELIEWMKQSTGYLSRGNFIYRGADFERSGKTGMFHGSTTGIRKSANTANYYTLWMDNAPAFKALPKRSKSFICSTDPHYAKEFGELSLVIPKDKTRIAGVGEKDIWGIEIGPKIQLNDLNVMTSDLFYSILGKSANTWDEMVEGCKSITVDLIKQKIKDNELETLEAADHLTLLEKYKVKSLYDMWQDYFFAGDFSLTTASHFSDDIAQEVWIQDDCMFLNLVNSPSSEDMEVILEFAEDFPKFKDLLENSWGDPSEVERIDPDTVSARDTLTQNHRGQY